MSVFSPAELAYLAGQRLGRLATAGQDGQPHVVPVGFRHNRESDTIDIGGRYIGTSKKVRDVRATGRAAFVVDDVESTDPWQPRGIEIRGRAIVIDADDRNPDSTVVRIFPIRVASWGIDDPDFYRRNARTVHVPEPATADQDDAKSERNWNAEVIAAFRANGGEVPAPYPDPPPMLLLHTIGARSGREHTVPMRCLQEGDTRYVFASAHGSDRNPDWYYNLLANPDIDIEQGTETVPVRASEVEGADREAVLSRWVARVPLVVDVLRKTDRRIPVMRLERR
jgi:pyridoxamine 5'-phosphate oxidase family protein